MEKQYLMVRAMTSQEKHFREFFDNSVVAVGWSNVHFDEYSDRDGFVSAIKKSYYHDKSGPKVGRNVNECIRFKKIKEGDLIIVPYNSAIALAIAGGKEFYSEKAFELDLANQHKVSYLYKDEDILSVPRNNLSEGLQRRLRVPGSTVLDLSEFADEIEKLFADPETYSYSNEAKLKEDALQRSFKKELLQNIQAGKTNLQTGGIGMENLVKELFICEGYEAKILSKTSFEGSADADILACRDDDFSSVNIYAQVKHHSGLSGRAGIEQIIQAVNKRNNDGYECKGVFVTSAKVAEVDLEYAEENNISVIDGEKLVDIIYERIEQLSNATKTKLGIVVAPSVLR